MKLSVMLFPFNRPLIDGTLTATTLINTLKDAGAEGVETMHGLEDSHPAIWQQLLDAIHAADLPIACHDIGVNLIGNAADRDQRLDEARRQILFAHDVLHTKTVLLYNSSITDSSSLAEGRYIYGRSLGKLADFAATLGISATIEDFDPTPHLACRAADCKTIIGIAGSHAGLTFDTGNFQMAGESPLAIFPLVRDLIKHVHIKDRGLKPVPDEKGNIFGPCVIGQGVAQIRECVCLLKNAAYEGFISAEIFGNKLEDAVSALQFLNDCR